MAAFYKNSLNRLEMPSNAGNSSSDWLTTREVEPPSLWAKILVLFLKEEEDEKDVAARFDLETFLEESEKIALQGGNTVEKKQKPKKSVSFLVDVPYKHSAEGEVFEGPISSQLTFEKEPGEEKEVFVNPERSA